MADGLSVELESYHGDDPEYPDGFFDDLNETITFKCTHWRKTGSNGLTFFPLKLLKILANALKVIAGDWLQAPVLVLDFGVTIETYFVDFTISGFSTKDELEAEAFRLDKFFRINNFNADELYLTIGHLTDSDTRMFKRRNYGVEGKIADYDFDWNADKDLIITGSFEFKVCQDFDIF